MQSNDLHHHAPSSMVELDPQCLALRVQELEEICRATAVVNRLLSKELEDLLVIMDKQSSETASWQQRSQALASRLDTLRKQQAAADAGGITEEELLCSSVTERLLADNSSSSSKVNACSTSGGGAGGMSATQKELLQALAARGKAAGWLLSSSDVVLGEVLGEGSFGITYRGTLRGGADVAIKVVRAEALEGMELTSFLREVECLSLVRHPHVLPFLGAVLSPPDRCWLVTEYMPGGSLLDWLYGGSGARSQSSSRPLDQRLKKAAEVAHAMASLHASSPPILHRDLKPANVYMDGGGRTRLGDFGLARRLFEQCRAGLTGETGSYTYMAPEVFRHEMYDSKADVWSWGVLLSELISGVPPYSHLYYTPAQIAMAVASEELSPALPESCAAPADFLALAQLTTDFDPEMRPDFASIVGELGNALRELERQPPPPETGLLSRLGIALPSAWRGLSTSWGPMLRKAAVSSGVSNGS